MSDFVVFYDGECGVCNAFVQYVLDRDKKKRITFAPLQGTTYAKMYGGAPDLTTVVVRDGAVTRVRSDAALAVLRRLGGARGFLGTLSLGVPRPFRDFVYNVIAKHRHRVVASCRLLTAEERTRFLP